MPYRKRPRNFRRRRRVKRGGLLSRFSNMRVGTVARKAMAGVRYLKSLVNSETFHKDSSVSGAVSTTPSVNHLTAIATGDADASRTGNSILCKRLTYNMSINMNVSSSDTWLRMVLLVDTQQVGDTAPQWTDVFSAATISSLLNVETLGRFTILRDKIYTMSISGRRNLQLKGSIPLKFHTRYNGNNSTDIQKNGVYLMFLSNEATNTPTVTSVWRLHYHDN